MNRLPVITGFGGISPAGRSSGHHGYKRLVFDALGEQDRQSTLTALAQVMQSEEAGPAGTDQLLAHTLVREIEPSHFDPSAVEWNRRMTWKPADDGGMVVQMRGSQLPNPLPAGWEVLQSHGTQVDVRISGPTDVLVPDALASDVRSAGQLPSGFDPQKLYQARSHPRGLQMTVYGASDALSSMGIDWDTVLEHVSPTQISVYAGSGMSQLDAYGNGGMMSARTNGKRVTSKHCPFGFAEMPADFINAYILGSLGNTGTSMGACASFLYNLNHGLADIRSGRARVAIIGNAEAPITPEVIEGYAAMGALATTNGLRKLDGLAEDEAPDFRRACRPFAPNCGFTIAESAQFVVLMDDELALELGAMIFGAVADVFVNADGYKKSISSPGVGNYLTMARAVAMGRAILGDEAVQQRSFVQAHGTGTPQNRTTESHILNETAKLFGIEQWPVAAIKAYLGHSIGCAGGDQLVMTLGTWAHGLIPGIGTIRELADDVHADHLQLQREHIESAPQSLDLAFINAKGFGGNNASATVLAPHVVEQMLGRRHGIQALDAWRARNEAVSAAAADNDARASRGELAPIYRFDHGVLGGDDIEMSQSGIRVPGYPVAVDLEMRSPYEDMQ